MNECSECGGDMKANDVIEGEIITCPDCGAELEVTSFNPLKFERAPKEAEDWGE